MFALTVLLVVLPLPLLFAIHEGEVFFTHRKWLEEHTEKLKSQFPKCSSFIEALSCLNKKGLKFVFAEEFFLYIMATTCMVANDHKTVMWVWAGFFMAFMLRVLINLLMAVIVRGYVPGLVSAVLMIPYFVFIGQLWREDAFLTVLVTILGLVLMIANFQLVYWIGKKTDKTDKLA